MNLLSFLTFTSFLTILHALPFRLSSVFGPNMVLQRDTTNPVWGWAKPNQLIYGSLFDTTTNVSVVVSSMADSVSGLFILSFPPQPASNPIHVYTITVSTQPISERCNLYAFSCDGASVAVNGVLFGGKYIRRVVVFVSCIIYTEYSKGLYSLSVYLHDIPLH